MIDLHTHSTVSDGSEAPGRIVEMAAAAISTIVVGASDPSDTVEWVWRSITGRGYAGSGPVPSAGPDQDGGLDPGPAGPDRLAAGGERDADPTRGVMRGDAVRAE